MRDIVTRSHSTKLWDIRKKCAVFLIFSIDADFTRDFVSHVSEIHDQYTHSINASIADYVLCLSVNVQKENVVDFHQLILYP